MSALLIILGLILFGLAILASLLMSEKKAKKDVESQQGVSGGVLKDGLPTQVDFGVGTGVKFGFGFGIGLVLSGFFVFLFILLIFGGMISNLMKNTF